MATDEPAKPAKPAKPAIPPIPGARPLTAAELARLKRMAAAGKRAEGAVAQLPHNEPDAAPESLQKPVIDIDADPHNANWLRILAQRKQEQQQKEQKEQSDHGR